MRDFNSLRVNRGDTYSKSLYINKGTELCPAPYLLTDDDRLYIGITEPHQSFEHAVIRKVLTSSSPTDKKGLPVFKLNPTDTINLKPGKYFITIKLQNIPTGKITTVLSLREFFIQGTDLQNHIGGVNNFVKGRGNTVTFDSTHGCATVIGDKNEVDSTNDYDASLSLTVGYENHTESLGGFTTGRNNTNKGDCSVVIGSSNNNEAYEATVIGSNNTNTANLARLFGHHLVNSMRARTVIGEYNYDANPGDINLEPTFIIGNGLDNTHRRNAFEVSFGGYAFAQHSGDAGVPNALINYHTLEAAKLWKQGSVRNSAIFVDANGGTSGNNSAVQIYDLARGDSVTANAKYGTAIGNTVSVTGQDSIGHGFNIQVSQPHAAAFGIGLRNDAYGATRIGKWNADDAHALFQVGNGSSNTNRKNVFEVLDDNAIRIGITKLTENSLKMLNGKVTTITSAATDSQYPTAKAVWDLVYNLFSAWK